MSRALQLRSENRDPLFLHYRIVILCNSFYLINVCWFCLFLAYRRSKIMLPSVWKIVFTEAALFCTAVDVAEVKERLKLYQVFSFIYKSLQSCWCLSETLG